MICIDDYWTILSVVTCEQIVWVIIKTSPKGHFSGNIIVGAHFSKQQKLMIYLILQLGGEGLQRNCIRTCIQSAMLVSSIKSTQIIATLIWSAHGECGKIIS